MEYKLIESKNIFKQLGIDRIPSNIDMFYDLSYQLSTYIYDYRTSHNLTQKAFAELLEVRQPMVSKLESGNYNISLQNICDVMAKLNTRVGLTLKPICEGVETVATNYSPEMNTVSNKDIKELGIAI